MRKAFAVGLMSTAWIVGGAQLAGAHNEIEPSEAAPGSTIELTLNVENERADAGTSRVELYFPTGVAVPVVAIPVVAGWTSTVDAPPAQPQTRIVWQGGPARDDFELPFTIGPLPAAETRLQFKVLQTYSNGEIDRWIQEWPAGATEPDRPGPVLDLKIGAAGTAPASSAPTTGPRFTPTTTSAASTPTTVSALGTAGGGSNGVRNGLIGAIVGVVLAAGVVALARARMTARRRPE